MLLLMMILLLYVARYVTWLNTSLILNVVQYTCLSSPPVSLVLSVDVKRQVQAYFQPAIKIEWGPEVSFADNDLCRMTYEKAERLARYHDAPNVIHIFVSDVIEEDRILGFAQTPGSHVYVHKEAVPYEFAILLAHELGHALSLPHPFQDSYTELERVIFVSTCPSRDPDLLDLYNLMDYLPTKCSGQRFFNESQLKQMKLSLLLRKGRVHLLFSVALVYVLWLAYHLLWKGLYRVSESRIDVEHMV